MRATRTSLVICLLLSSCAQFSTSEKSEQKPQKTSQVEKQVEKQAIKPKEKKKVSEAKREVLQAKEQSHNHHEANRIVGSAKISEPLAHNTQTYYLYGAEHMNLENYYFDIPVVYNAAVKKWIDYFVGRGRKFFKRYSARAGRYAPILGKILDNHGLPRDLIFLAMAESGFHNKAKSWAKAVGPWQFMSYTARHYGLTVDWYLDERRDPIKATIAASKYLKKLYDEFGSWELAAAGYNAGEGKVRRAIKRYGTESFWELRRHRYLKRETKEYVPKIMALAIIGKNLKTFGFEEIQFHEPLNFEEIEVAGFTDLMKLSRKLNLPFEELQRLNPEIRRWFTSPRVGQYRLRVPLGKAQKWKKCCSSEGVQKQLVAKDFQPYRVRGMRSRLSDVSQKFSVKDSEVLAEINGLGKRQRLNRGQVVYLPFRKGQSKRADMYSDLYDKPRRQILVRRKYRKIVAQAKKNGEKIQSPSEYYTVQRGDSLWSVSRKTGVDLNTLIVSNLEILNHRMIRAGDELAIR